MRRRAGDRVDQRLQGLLEDVHFLKKDQSDAGLVRLGHGETHQFLIVQAGSGQR